MKKLITYLKTLWSRVADSQRKEVGVISGEATIEHPFSTYSAPFGTCWQPSGKLHSVVRCAAMLVMLFTIGIGNVWGETVSVNIGTYATANSWVNESKYATVTIDANVTATGLTNGNNSKYYSSNNSWRHYEANSGTITIETSSGTLSSVTFTYSKSNNGTIKYNNANKASGTAISVSGTSVTFTVGRTSGSSNGNIQITAISVTYTPAASCTQNPTVTAGSNSSVTATTARVSCSSGITSLGSAGCSISSYGFVLNTTGTPTISDTKHQVGTTYITTGTSFYKDLTELSESTTYYVRPYATNGNGTAYGTQTSFTTPALPKYTVTYNAGTGTCGTAQWTQPSYGASTSLPSATAPGTCTGYSFAGWCTSSAGSSDNNTSSPGTILLSGSSYTPTGDITLYAVYTKTVDGGGSSWVETDFADLTSSDVFVLATPAGYALPSNGGNAKPVVSAITVSAGKITSTVTDGLKWNMSGNSTDGYTFYPNGTTSTWLCCTTTASSGTNDNIRINNAGSRKVWITDSDGDLKTKDTYTDRWLCCYNSADFRGYTASNVTSDIISKCYKYSSGTTYYMTSLVCCTEVASINGSFSFTSVGTTGATANWGWTGATTGISKNILKVYKESDNSLVATIDNISASATSQAITGLDPCTEYYVKLSTVSSGGGYCDGVADQTGASHVTFTTSSYTVTKTGVTNVTAASLSAIPATTCASGFGPITIEAASGYVLPATVTVTGATGSWTQASGSLTISSVTGNVSITITPTAASCASFSFHTGTGEDATVKTTNTTTCFSQVNSSTTWKIDNYVIPADTKFFVGDRGFFYDDNLGSNNSRSAVKTWSQEMFFEYTKVYGDGYRPTVGQATGAIGTLYIWSDNNWNNLHVGFSPQGYVFKLGSANLAMSGSATLDADRYWETSVITLTSTDISGNYQTNLYTGSAGGVASNNTQSTAVNTMGVKTNAGDNWRGTAINDGTDANTRGFFRIDIGDGGAKNWHAHWVPTHRVVFHPNYPSGGGEDQYSVDVSVEETNSSIALASAPSNPTGYTFAGWYDAADGGNHITTARTISAGASANVELWAHWTANTISLTLNKNTEDAGSNNGSGSIDFDATSGTISTAPTRTGYTVEGYYTDAACTAANKVLTNTGAVVNSTVSGYTTSGKWTRATTPTTLYTKWTPNNYTVTWHVGDATSTSTVAYNTEFQDISVGKPSVNNNSLSACESNYFVGWVTSGGIRTTDGGTVALYNSNKVNATDKITDNIDFYAMFATSSGGGSPSYKKVTSTSNITNDGRYLIVEETDGVVFNGGLSTIDATNNVIAATFTAGVLAITDGNRDNLAAAEFSIDMTNLYIKNKDNKYIYQDSYGNGLPNTTTPTALHSISIDGDEDFIVEGNGQNSNSPYDYAVLRFNNNTGSGNWRFRFYKGSQQKIQLYKYDPGTTYSNYRTNCAACANTVTVSYNAAPTGGTVAVEKGGIAIANNGTVKTCDGSVNLTVTITPASHYTVTGLTAQISSTDMSQSNVGNVYTVTIPQNQTGTLVLTPNLTEDAHKIITWVVHGGSASIADGHGTTWVYSGENLTAIPEAPDAPTGCDDKVFVGWSENDGGATEEDASYYDDLFTTLGEAPTGITTDKTFTAVFATPAAGLGGTVMWDEPFDGDAGGQPSSPTSGATVYGSASIAYNCASTTYCKLYTDNLASGGAAAPELLVPKSSRSEAFEVTGIPTAGQTELTLTYMAKDALSVTTGTSGVTVGDASADGKLYTRTITIDQSGLGVATFGLTFAKSTDSNSRLDDIHLEVPGSSSMSGYVTTCEDTWTVTYYKNTEDAVTNLPSPTGISKSTGSGTLSSKVPVRYGYTFDGWATSAGGSVAYAAGAAVSSVSADMDLYAKWSVTPVTEINLSKTSLDKYVGDPSVTLSVLSVLPDGANTSVTWSSSNSSIATVNSSTGEVNFVAEGTANIIATSSITSGTTATCVVTVWAKPTVSFLDNLHSLTEDKDGNALSGYNLTDVAGTPVVFPILANQPAGSGTCEDEHYVFVGWTTSDNNTDPEDHLVTSHNLTNGDNITYYAVWADGVAGTTYTKLTSSTFKTTPTRYVLGAEYNGTTKYFYSCEKTDKNNSWGYVTADLASNTPIEFTLSGTASALVATSTEVSARYLKPMAEKDFQMSASSQTVELKSDGTIYNPVSTSWKLLYNNANSLRWYDSNISGSANAYFYEVVAGGEVNYRTSCCADKVAAPTVTATKTSTTVTLTWAAVSGATGYELQWNGGAWTAATSGVVKSDLTPNTNYSWRVRATYVPPKCGADIASGNTTTNQVYHVTYAGGSGTGSCNATGSTTDGTAYEAGATVTLQSNGFTLVGHTFNEWTEDDEDITISSNQFTMPEHDVVITATWTPKVDKFYDRMHDGTDASHGGIADGDGKYYITREGCSYTVPSLTDNTSGATACHTKHYVLMGWTAESHLNSDGTLKTGHEGYVYTGGGTQTATGATYYAVWAEVEE